MISKRPLVARWRIAPFYKSKEQDTKSRDYASKKISCKSIITLSVHFRNFRFKIFCCVSEILGVFQKFSLCILEIHSVYLRSPPELWNFHFCLSQILSSKFLEPLCNFSSLLEFCFSIFSANLKHIWSYCIWFECYESATS